MIGSDSVALHTHVGGGSVPVVDAHLDVHWMDGGGWIGDGWMGGGWMMMNRYGGRRMDGWMDG